MPEKSYLCYVSGAGHSWEAICVDFDIAVHGRSIDDVMLRLFDAVHTFVEAARQETPDNRERLLGRKTPWPLRARLRLAVIVQAVLGRRGVRPDRPTRFSLPCPA